MLDHDELDDPSARSGLMRVDVSGEWLERGTTLVVEVPKRLTCATCDGGGCGLCDNSGAFRLGQTPLPALRIRVAPGPAEPKRIRIASPWGESGPIQRLILDLKPAEAPSSHVKAEMARYRSAAPLDRRSLPPTSVIALVMIALAMAIAMVIALAMRS